MTWANLISLIRIPLAATAFQPAARPAVLITGGASARAMADYILFGVRSLRGRRRLG